MGMREGQRTALWTRSFPSTVVLGIESGAGLVWQGPVLTEPSGWPQTVSRSPGWPSVRCIAEGDLKPLVFLPLPPTCLDKKMSPLWIMIPERIVG